MGDTRRVGSSVTIRRASAKDLAVLGQLGGSLLRTHYQFDPLRFMAPGDDPEGGYEWFLGTQIEEADVAVFVAERDSLVIGYVYAGIEPQSWKELREQAGFIHDVVVSETARGGGVATALIDAAIEWFRSRDMPRVVLWSAEGNDKAQRLFGKMGFRRTMVEMTRELSR